MLNRQYPIGPFAYAGPHTATERDALIARIESLPARLRIVAGWLSERHLDTPYRDGGWTARQVVHHIADSHMHSLLRFKFALAADGAAIVSYPEQLWAELPDYRSPIDTALAVIDAVHAKWIVVLRAMQPADFARAFRHPENGLVTLDKALAIYAWHGDHHMAHVHLVAGE